MMKFGILVIAAALSLVGLGQTKADELERWEVVERMVLLDTFTDLEWTRRDNLKDINWNDAKAYCDSLEMGGGGWRLPTMDELGELYDPSRYEGMSCGGMQIDENRFGKFECYVPPLFYLTGPNLWSSEQSSARERTAVTLVSGNNYSLSVSDPSKYVARALCVRLKF